MRIIETKAIHKYFGHDHVVKDLNIWVKENRFLTLLGPSGCGKTTTLRMIGGFEKPTTGVIDFYGQPIQDTPPYLRPINTVFQKYALFPHLNIYENIAFGLRIQKVGEEEIKRRVGKMLELVNLTGFEKRATTSLSGGQQQRIAIARALVNEPKVLLLDEPLGALDLKLRKEMQHELKDMQRELGITFIYVTHDQEEALTMSDKIIVMNKGAVQQIGRPTDIYNEPENAFVADFIGESNIIQGAMLDDYLVHFSGHDFVCVDKGFDRDQAVDVVIRPEDVLLKPLSQKGLHGVVVSTVFKGVHYEMLVACQGQEWLVHSTQAVTPGEHVSLDIKSEDIHVMKQVV